MGFHDGSITLSDFEVIPTLQQVSFCATIGTGNRPQTTFAADDWPGISFSLVDFAGALDNIAA